MRFVGKTFNLNTIILENQSASFYQFIGIILLFYLHRGIHQLH